jgi:hypothetical protein
MFSNSAYSAVNKIVPNERAERRRWVSYVTDPTETRARLNDVRFQSKERSIYDPLAKKLPEIYKEKKPILKMNNTVALMQTAERNLPDKEVINLLNTVSEKKRKPFQTTLNHDTHDLL